MVVVCAVLRFLCCFSVHAVFLGFVGIGVPVMVKQSMYGGNEDVVHRLRRVIRMNIQLFIQHYFSHSLQRSAGRGRGILMR